MVIKPTPEELTILADEDFLKHKNSLSQKIISYMAQIERAIHRKIDELPFQFPDGTFLKAGKISRGEQYRQLPYFILDYPRLFTQKEVFAFRTMLWWGNHFSCTLHLAGNTLHKHKEQLLERILQTKDLYFCVNKQPWEYHYDSTNYLPADKLTIAQMMEHIKNNNFVKISNKISVQDWEQFEAFTLKSFERFLLLVK